MSATHAARFRAGRELPWVDVAILGRRMHYAVPSILHRAGRLGRLYTDFYIGNKPLLTGLLDRLPRMRRGPLARIRDRCSSDLPPSRVRSFDVMHLLRWIRHHLVDGRGGPVEELAAINRRFATRVAAEIGPPATVIYGCNGACVEVFRAAREAGWRCVVEQTIAPRRTERRLLREELDRWPGWQPGAAGRWPAEDVLAEREEAEWRLAARVVGASDFVRRGFVEAGGEPSRFRRVPYGVDLGRFFPREQAAADGRLRVLFSGEVGLRKGVPDLLEALRLLGDASRARLVGPVVLDPGRLAPYRDHVTVMGHVPARRMPEMLRWADVLVLPSLCEGSATVTYEALASGVPVVATPNAGSPVRDGIDGRLVPIRDPEAIAAALEAYVLDSDRLRAHREVAIRDRARVGLGTYARGLLGVFAELGP